jgi:hypothetical protein
VGEESDDHILIAARFNTRTEAPPIGIGNLVVRSVLEDESDCDLGTGLKEFLAALIVIENGTWLP